jgi:FkbM family methyltransferase
MKFISRVKILLKKRNMTILFLFLIVCCILLTVYNFNTKKESFLELKEFEFYDMNKTKQKNTTWGLEVEEQLALQKYLKKTDFILQLGGNIGLSCIMADKILNNNKNICVEPHPKVIPVLEKNKEFTKSKFNIIKGAITKRTNLKINDADRNFLGSTVQKEGTHSIQSINLKNIPNIEEVNVLFADCEGCLCGFFEEFPKFIDQIRLIIFEQDQVHMCDYNKIKKILGDKGFKNVQDQFVNVWEKTKL